MQLNASDRTLETSLFLKQVNVYLVRAYFTPEFWVPF